MTIHECYYCGMMHSGICARVASIEYHPDGTVKRVTFHADAPVVQLGPLTLNPWAHVNPLRPENT